jgi:hypothetical protein
MALSAIECSNKDGALKDYNKGLGIRWLMNEYPEALSDA